MKVLVIDNYDSFTFNLVQYLGGLGAEPEVVRNDALTIEEISRKAPDRILISPGPGTPADAGISEAAIARFSGVIPILGICLGHQALGEVYGGRVCRAPELRHGKTSEIHHAGDPLFAGLDNPFIATRYHSLIVDRASLPRSLEITAWTADGLVMGLRVRGALTWGVQFHPESILTAQGMRIMENFLCCRN